jgi:acetyltransferase-like isoleucine patch superfamily enzyme
MRADLIQRLRIAWLRRRWTCAEVAGTPELRMPVMLAGQGRIGFGARVVVGWEQSPGFLSGYSYVEARNPGSEVTFGDETHLNNGVTFVSEGPGIAVGRRCLIGTGVHVYDSDFHALDASERRAAAPRMARVEIGDDVFIGTNALVLKGVTVGAGSVVGAGAVVIADVPPGAVVAGNPAQVVRAPSASS